MTAPSPEEFAAKMREIFPGKYPDIIPSSGSHQAADRLLCAVLRSLGYGEGVEAFEDAPKWYA
jgi:hypothetical protein